MVSPEDVNIEMKLKKQIIIIFTVLHIHNYNNHVINKNGITNISQKPEQYEN